MIQEVVIFCAGIIGILCSTHYLLRSADHLCRLMAWPSSFTGVIILGLGTSLPEIVISLYSHAMHHDNLLMGNILGSNLTNLLLILGITCLFLRPRTDRKQFVLNWQQYGVMLLLTVTLGLSVLFHHVPRVVGIVSLLIAIWIFMRIARDGYKLQSATRDVDQSGQAKLIWRSATFTVIWLMLMLVSGQLIVSSGIRLAVHWHLHQGVFAAIFLAISTSLPEIAVAIVAGYQQRFSLILDTVIGSNIANIGFAVGLTAGIRPIVMDHLSVLAVSMVVVSILLMVWLKLVARWPKLSGLLALLGYAAMLAMLL